MSKPGSRAALPGHTDNLAELENLNEATLLDELKIRFKRDTIYTYVGEILVTVNPFKWIGGLYDPDKMRLYSSVGDKNRLQPHVYAVSDIAFQTMRNSGKDQVCVISGESGAGKTEAAKLFIKQLVQVSNGAEFEGLEAKLLEVNPVLEAFGNAKTQYNNNSSRFGKFISVKFNKEGAIRGATQTEYLLEKSRVVHQTSAEQNFHIFYIFFNGFGQDPRFSLGAIDDYRFTCANPDACADVNGKHFSELKAELMDAFKIVGFTDEQLEDLFKLLSGVLHLGDIEFEGEDAARLSSAPDLLTKVCDQLGVDETAVELALTRQINIIRGEETERKLRLEQAEDVRDAAAKAIYQKAFGWLVQQCNQQLGESNIRKALPGDTSMGILDIFGFECFESNSFEQLCINLTNEQLQWYFNEHIFAMELAEYAKEGISGKDISYENNEPLLELILSSKPLGMLGIIDEESNFPKATDSTMILKFHEAFKTKKDYTRPRGNEEIFTLTHYAGAVAYEGYGFLEKNRDTLAVDVVGALRLSENSLVKMLFGGEKDAAAARGGAGGRHKPKGARQKMDRQKSQGRMRQSIKHARASLAKKKQRTVAAVFKSSLSELMDVLKASEPHFIRCVKPNHEKEADLFHDELVTKQLRYTGMLETTRIRREGYASRPLFADFVQRYKVLGFPCRQDVRPSAESCRQILKSAGISGFEVGKTKVFMRYYHADELNGKLEPFVHAATILSRYCRGYTARSKYGALLEEKHKQDASVMSFFNTVERGGQGIRDVVLSLMDEDSKRPADYFTKAAAAPPLPEKKSASKGKKKGGMNRAASVKWFKEVEESKGSGKTDDGGFAAWFHGIITRMEAEALLKGQASGTFLIRVAETRFGYSLSLMFKNRCKHFMIDQDDQNRYLVVGNDRTFPSLNEVVAFHSRHPVTDDGDTLLIPCPTSGPRDDLAELE